MKYLAFLFITVLILALGACGSGEPITLAGLEGIGFKKDSNTTSTYDYEDINEAWDGEITINGAPEFLEVVIFSSIPDDFRNRWKIMTMAFSMRSSIINNIAIACETQETCDYVKDKLR